MLKVGFRSYNYISGSAAANISSIEPKSVKFLNNFIAQNIELVGSYVWAISVAAASIPRQVAFEVFIGTTSFSGNDSQAFISGIDRAFYASIAILAVAGILSFIRGKDVHNNPKT